MGSCLPSGGQTMDGSCLPFFLRGILDTVMLTEGSQWTTNPSEVEVVRRCETLKQCLRLGCFEKKPEG